MGVAIIKLYPLPVSRYVEDYSEAYFMFCVLVSQILISYGHGACRSQFCGPHFGYFWWDYSDL